jgi:hypothetical protein
VLVGVPDEADLPMTDLVQFDGIRECLAKQPDLYTDADTTERFR